MNYGDGEAPVPEELGKPNSWIKFRMSSVFVGDESDCAVRQNFSDDVRQWFDGIQLGEDTFRREDDVENSQLFRIGPVELLNKKTTVVGKVSVHIYSRQLKDVAKISQHNFPSS